MPSAYKLAQNMAPMLRRALIVDPHVASARLISGILRDHMDSHVWTAQNTLQGLKLAKSINPDIIFVEYAAEGLDGLDFARQLRRSSYACRKAAMVMVTGLATEAIILGARDAGVHEFLCKPFSLKEMMRRLQAVTLRQRDWVESMNYSGPDRRRFNSGDYSGPRKRSDDDATLETDQDRIERSLKIVRSAVQAAKVSPAQAVRSMLAQAEDIELAAERTANPALANAAGRLHDYLDIIAQAPGLLDTLALAREAEALLWYLPPDEDLSRTAAA